jgi:hypothetical protein
MYPAGIWVLVVLVLVVVLVLENLAVPSWGCELRY